MANAKQLKGEKELHGDIQEGLRHLTAHCLRAATVAHHIGVLNPSVWTTTGGIEALGRELGSIARQMQAAGEWESRVMDAWKAFAKGAR